MDTKELDESNESIYTVTFDKSFVYIRACVCVFLIVVSLPPFIVHSRSPVSTLYFLAARCCSAPLARTAPHIDQTADVFAVCVYELAHEQRSVFR